MALFKCKMCGGTLEISGQTVGVCEYCGTTQTLPRLDNDKRVNLYDRANHLRRSNEFDKAMGIYEQILSEDSTDAEAYWSLVLCRYGIEYVEDPSTHKRIPTVNRAQLTAIFDDPNYRSALQYSDEHQRTVYQAEARAINEIQKAILAISQKEKPFDVFICYKETDENGKRTPDSVLANDLYHQLTGEGFKVFFSRITLEDKLGTAYEPYIFAALNSAKVMVVLGTKPEYFGAVWVRNEWSRYLSLIKQGAKKMLVPAYKDMDPYNLPEEFSHLQALDMSKLGFMQDLIRGIKKIVRGDAVKAASNVQAANGTSEKVVPILKRAFLFLEDGAWDNANDYLEKVLDLDPENALAYVGKLMLDLRVKKMDSLKDCAKPFTKVKSYEKAVRFADDELRATLEGYINHINTRNENARMESVYVRATAVMKSARIGNVFNYETAMKLFQSVSAWKDSAKKAEECKKAIDDINARIKAEKEHREREQQEELERQRARKRLKIKIALIAVPTICAIAAIVFVVYTIIIPGNKYNNAVELMENGKYAEAIAIFDELGDYEDSLARIPECRYAYALSLMSDGKYDLAIAEFEVLGDYNDSASKLHECRYAMALSLMTDGKYDEAISAFEALSWYKDSKSKIKECRYAGASALEEAGNIVDAYEAFAALGDYEDSTQRASALYKRYKVEKLKTAQVGDYVFFGTYEQDNDSLTGAEDIEWIVLEVRADRMLVVSRYALESKAYNTAYAFVTWENSTIRNWLNGEFLSAAFTDDERALISTERVSDENNRYGVSWGNETSDKVFLLSASEAKAYFDSDSARMCKPTKSATAKGMTVYGNGCCAWWLRTPGYNQTCASFVSEQGVVNEYGGYVNYEHFGISPAMWISLNY